MVIFLSTSCPSCQEIAGAIGPSVPDHLHVVVSSATPEVARKWLVAVGIPPHRCIIDGRHSDGAEPIMNRLGLTSTPSAVVITGGLLSHATSVPSSAALFSLVQDAAEGMVVHDA